MSETLPDLKKESAAASPDVVLGFGNAAGFAMLQRAASLLANSTLVPEAYRKWIKNKNDKFGPLVENEAALSNCVIALNMAQRLEADPIMIMQNLYVVEGRPSWSSQFIIAALNTTGRFSPLRFRISEPVNKTVQVTTVNWVNKQKQEKKENIEIQDRTCIAWAIEKETGERLESPPISIEMAAKEGWLTKKGSKWQTMPDLMLRYRAATLFGRLYAPEKLMGLQTEEENRDVYELEPANGGYSLPEATPADHTADILKRAAQGQDDHPQGTAPAATNGQKKPRATTAMRDGAAKAVTDAGLDLAAIEKSFGAYSKDWSYSQCEQAQKMAADAQEQPAEPHEESFECPNNGATVRLSVECAACDQNGLCPSTDGKNA
ncbi:hypothetical protein [Solidesulfovibrio sp. C21]|uniref:hypothetical protein n=1 Tax=Solidesulfovibrio sp. C21 TaxID=3398613 RepID=UPI0039FBD524